MSIVSLARLISSMFDRRPAKAARRIRRTNGSRPRMADVEMLESRRLLTVTYHGGALIPHVEAQNVFLGNEWQTNTTAKQMTSQLDTYVSSLVSGPFMDMLTNAGYGVGRGTATAGVTDNIVLNTTKGIHDSQIQSDLQQLISNNQVQAPNASTLYVVYVEPNVAVYQGGSSSIKSFLGYHGAFAGKTASGAPIDIHYAVMPYPGSPNPTPKSQGFPSIFADLTVVTSHEVAESVTDPNVGYKTLGWYDNKKNGEIGDLTNATATLNGYLVQEIVNQNDVAMNPNYVQPPLNPTVVASSSTSAELTWTTVLGATGYRIYQVVSGKSVVVATLSASATSYIVPNLTPGSTDTFTIQAYNSVSTAQTSALTVSIP